MPGVASSAGILLRVPFFTLYGSSNTLYNTFDFISVVAYVLRLEMIERWIGLNNERGEKAFRSLVTEMKRESKDTLEKFKENNK